MRSIIKPRSVLSRVSRESLSAAIVTLVVCRLVFNVIDTTFRLYGAELRRTLPPRSSCVMGRPLDGADFVEKLCRVRVATPGATVGPWLVIFPLDSGRREYVRMQLAQTWYPTRVGVDSILRSDSEPLRYHFVIGDSALRLPLDMWRPKRDVSGLTVFASRAR